MTKGLWVKREPTEGRLKGKSDGRSLESDQRLEMQVMVTKERTSRKLRSLRQLVEAQGMKRLMWMKCSSNSTNVEEPNNRDPRTNAILIVNYSNLNT